jgi:hypothetical protein
MFASRGRDKPFVDLKERILRVVADPSIDQVTDVVQHLDKPPAVAEVRPAQRGAVLASDLGGIGGSIGGDVRAAYDLALDRRSELHHDGQRLVERPRRRAADWTRSTPVFVKALVYRPTALAARHDRSVHWANAMAVTTTCRARAVRERRRADPRRGPVMRTWG